MSTVKELKKYLKQFPDDMEIELCMLTPEQLEMLMLMHKTGYIGVLGSYELVIEKYNQKITF